MAPSTRHSFRTGLINGIIFGGILLGSFAFSARQAPAYSSVSIDTVKNGKARLTYYTKAQGAYKSPKFNRVKLKQSKLGPIKIYFYDNKKLVATRNLREYDQTRLERIND